MNGQAKIDFEKWLMNGNDGVSNFARTIELTRVYFLSLKETCQHALIIEWFDSVGIYIGIEVYGSPEFEIKYEAIVSTKSDDWYLQGQFSEIYFSRPQATEKAIEKAIILYNEKFKENE